MSDCTSSETGRLPELEEGLIYDAMVQINRRAEEIVKLVNDHGTPDQKQAYKDCIYAVSMKLGMIIGVDGIRRQEARHKEMDRKLQEFIEKRKK